MYAVVLGSPPSIEWWRTRLGGADLLRIGRAGVVTMMPRMGCVEIHIYIRPGTKGWSTKRFWRQFQAEGFKRGHRLEASIGAHDATMLGIAEALGWTKEGTRREAVEINGRRYDVVMYSLLRGEGRWK